MTTAVLTAPAPAPATPVAPVLRIVPTTEPEVVSLPFRIVPAPASAPPYDDEIAAGAPVLRLLPALAPPPAPVPFDDDAWLADARTPTAQLPSAEAFTRRLVQVLLEVIAGVRPIAQLRPDVSPELYLCLRRTVMCRPPSPGPRPDRRAIRSVHVQVRPEGIAEACATVRRGPRVAAVALRLEGVDGHWRCTELNGAARV